MKVRVKLTDYAGHTIAELDSKVADWLRRFADNQAFALGGADPLIEAVALHAVLREVSRQVARGDALEEIRRAALGQVVNGARRGSTSTATMQNVMRDAMTQAWAAFFHELPAFIQEDK